MGSRKGLVKTALVIPDCHIPFESDLYDVMLKIARLVPLSEIVLLGDYIDLYGLSFYDKHPDLGDVADLFERELECTNVRLDELDELAVTQRKRGADPVRKIYLEGNHEYRMVKFLDKNAQALRKRVKLRNELGLHQRPKWKWVPFTKTQIYNVLNCGLLARHCPPVGGTARNVAKQSGASVIYGHTHQYEIGTFVHKLTGDVHYAINAGWLGNGEERVFDYVQNRPNWSTAFGFVHAVGKQWWWEPIFAVGGQLFFRGNLYK